MVTRAPLAVRSVVVLAAIIVTVAASATSVRAEVLPGPAPATQANPPTSSVELAGTGNGQGVNGFMSTLTPAERLGGYPATVPQPGWSASDVGFAGLIQMRVTSGPGVGTTFFSYCIDLLTPTNIGYDYKRGEWTEANIPNVGYVAQLLQSYFPTTNEPSTLGPNARAAAVQSAIWYFSDGYVLRSSSPLFATVRDIVSNVISKGPLTAPPPPNVTVTGPSSGLKNTVVGPFVVDTNGEVAIGTVPEGVTAFADAAGSSSLPASFPVEDGDEIWLRSNEAGIKNPALTISAVATQPGGVVYVYVPQAGRPAQAQTIIQAGPLTAETDVNTRVAFLDIGSFTVTKSITGDGAGQQGPIRIDIVCSTPNSSVPPFTIPGGAPGGTVTTVVTGITVPARCLLTETASGATQEVDVFADAPAAASRAAVSPAAASPAAVGARRSAQFATQEVSVCPASSFSSGAQPLAASAGAEFQAAPAANFQNVVEATTTTTAGSTTTSSSTTTTGESTTTTTSSTSSTDSTTSTTATTTSTTASTTTPTTPTTGATTTAATTTGATTTGATTTAATTTVAPTTVVPTTAADECELAGDTTSTTVTTGPETLPATGSSGSGPLAVGLMGLVAGVGLVAVASRRGFTE